MDFCDVKRIDHQTAHSLDGTYTNHAKSYFSRLRRGDMGDHHISGPDLLRYAQEAAWREDDRRVANGDQARRVLGSRSGAARALISPATGIGT